MEPEALLVRVGKAIKKFVYGVIFALGLVFSFFLIFYFCLEYIMIREPVVPPQPSPPPAISTPLVTPVVPPPATPEAPPPATPKVNNAPTTPTRTAQVKVQEFIIVDKIQDAKLREVPNSEESLLTIKAGTKLKILEKKDVRTGPIGATWYKVSHKGKTGWLSQYVTTGEIIREEEKSGTQEVAKIPYMNSPREYEFDQQAKTQYAKWLIENTAVTRIEFASDWQLFVRLTPDKYTSEIHVEAIAAEIGRGYKLQTNYKDRVTVTVFEPFKDEIYAKVRVP